MLGAKQQALLALLATAPGGIRTRAFLQTTLWCLVQPEQSAASLRTALSSLKKILGKESAILQSNRERVWLDLQQVQVILPKPGDTFLEGLDIRGEELFEDWLRDQREAIRNKVESVPSLRTQMFGLTPPAADPGNEIVLPTIAVLPFFNNGTENQKDVVGHLISELISRSLSRHESFSVISHLSTRNFTSRFTTADQISSTLNVNYLLSGSCCISGRLIRLDVELHSLDAHRILWSREFVSLMSDVLAGESDIAQTIGANACRAVLRESVELVGTKPLPTIESHHLLMAGISMMQKPDQIAFAEAGRALEAVVQKVPKHPIPLAWLANWHTMCVNKGVSNNPSLDFGIAQNLADRALEIDPYCSFALAVRGLIDTFAKRDLPSAQKYLGDALDVNPSQPLAHLHMATVSAFDDDPQKALLHAEKALLLSPLDPQLYFFKSLAATAHLAAGRLEQALDLANGSLKLNCNHPSTLRVKTIALQQLGRFEEAQKSLRKLRNAEPHLTVRSYLARHPSGQSRTGQNWAKALRDAGLPN
ncbi:tetratricopeptide repeat protein [Roseibium sp.]|uniref:tetratricopeptide repeat protein n=1 Tax=Roseibium sp. TaxID=1936156 RepID=UPI00391CC162